MYICRLDRLYRSPCIDSVTVTDQADLSQQVTERTGRHRNIAVSHEDSRCHDIRRSVYAEGYFVRSCIYNRICVVGKKETIYPLLQTVNALYLQLLKMQKEFTANNVTPDALPSLESIKELQTEYTNMLTAIIDLLDGAKYLWEGDHHE